MGADTQIIERRIYDAYKKNIDIAIENAFQSIAWLGSPPDFLQKASGNSVAFPIGNTFVLLATIGLIEGAGTGSFAWKITTSLIITKTKKIHKSNLWTRKHRISLINVAKAFFVGCGDSKERMSYNIESSILVGYKRPSDEDLEVIKAAKQERDEAILKTIEAEKPKPKRKPPKKKDVTVQNDL
jgi:hypothetical protein